MPYRKNGHHKETTRRGAQSIIPNLGGPVDLYQDMTKVISESASESREKMTAWAEEGLAWVEKNPLPAVGVAFVAGIALMGLFRLGKRS